MIRRPALGKYLACVVFLIGMPVTISPVIAQTATLVGTVNHASAEPSTTIDMNADPSCAALHSEPVPLDALITDGEGHLADVFVYLKDAPASRNSPVPEEPHLLDQAGCQYMPHVSGMRTGQTLVIRNSDETLHNVHAVPRENEEFNYGQPFQGMETERVFDTSEVMIRFKCDVHPWMSAYVGVLDHPFFAVSAGDGSFSIEGIPPGTYTLEAWHEGFETRTVEVTLQASQTEEVTLDF